MELLNFILLLAIVSIILGVCIKLIRKTFYILAYPMYLGLYALETFSPIRLLHLPKGGDARYLMDLFTALCSLITFRSFYKLALVVQENKQFNINAIVINKALLSNHEAFLFLLSLAIIFAISYNNRHDDHGHPFDRIKNLKTPKLFDGFK